MSKNNLPAWDLSDLYKNITDPKIKKDLGEYKKLSLSLEKKYKGKLETISAKDFADALKTYEKIATLGRILGSFASLNMSTKMKDKEAMAFYQNTSEALNTASIPTIFFTLEINRLSEKKIASLLKDKDVKYYEPFINTVRRFKDHELSHAVEEILHEKSVTSSDAWVRLYEETSSRLEYIVDGKTYNDAEISKLLLDKDPKVRKKAGLELNRVQKTNAPLFAFIYNMIIKDQSISDDKRGYKKPISSQNLSNNVEDKIVDALAETVRDNYAKIAHRFYKLKAKWLGVKQIEYWDRNAPLPFSTDKTYTWDESVKIVLDAYAEFSPKLFNIAKPFFDNAWIDVPPRDGKRSGAFAASVSAAKHPYLFLNFVGKQNDVLTLAHELGHGCHMRLSKKQGELNDSTPLTLAEVASVFGEMVTFKSLLRRAESDKEKLVLIASKVGDMINTAIRQITFHSFETRAHNERKSGELTEERLCEIWLEEMRTSLGPNVIVDDNSANIWSVVGHFFFLPFYVYAYSFADCLVNSLFSVYEEGKTKDFEDKYLHLLSETGIKKYDELLKPFKLDAGKKDFWQKGLDVISSYIDELERLDKKLF